MLEFPCSLLFWLFAENVRVIVSTDELAAVNAAADDDDVTYDDVAEAGGGGKSLDAANEEVFDDDVSDF